MKILKYILFSISVALALPLAAQTKPVVDTIAKESMTSGVVKKIDTEQGKITISHGPLLNLDMPAMTMVFRVSDPKLLTTVKAGDNIKFMADKVQGAYTVMHLEQAS